MSGLRLEPRLGDHDAALTCVHLAAPRPPQVSAGAQGQAAWAGGPALTPTPEAGFSGRLGAEQAGRAGRAGKPPGWRMPVACCRRAQQGAKSHGVAAGGLHGSGGCGEWGSMAEGGWTAWSLTSGSVPAL